MHAHGDLIQAERAREEVEPECDWSGWEKWLRSHLDIERENLIEALGGALLALSALGHKQTPPIHLAMSALPPKADIVLVHSRRQLFANAAIAASRVGS